MLRDAESAWLSDAARLASERRLLAVELSTEERGGAHARDLVVSCHQALLRGQQEQRKHADTLNAHWRRALARSAAQQTAMASDLRALAALLARCTAQRKAEATARRRAAATPSALGETTRASEMPRSQRRCVATSTYTAQVAQISLPRALTLATPVARGDARLDVSLYAALPSGRSGTVDAPPRATPEELPCVDDDAMADSHKVEEAMAPLEPDRHEDRAGAKDEALSAPWVAESALAGRNAALRSVLRSALTRRLAGAWSRWASHIYVDTMATSVAAAAVEKARAACVEALALRDEAKAESEKLRTMLRDARQRLAAERDQLQRFKAEKAGRAGSVAVARQLQVQVQVLQKRLQHEQALRQSEQRKRETHAVNVEANVAASDPAVSAEAGAVGRDSTTYGTPGRKATMDAWVEQIDDVAVVMRVAQSPASEPAPPRPWDEGEETQSESQTAQHVHDPTRVLAARARAAQILGTCRHE